MTKTFSIYGYSQFQHFLRDYVQEKKDLMPNWSYGVWARQMKLKSSSTLIMIVNGQRNPGPDLTKKLATFFKFNDKETEYFEALVRLQKAKNMEETVERLEELQQQNPNVRLVDLDNFRAMANWHYYAIRELVTQKDFREDYEWIAHYFSNRITAVQAKEVVDVLLKLQLLSRDKKGTLCVQDQHFKTPHDIADEGLKRFHNDVLELAQISLQNHSPQSREISGGTFAIQQSQLPKAKKLIRKFQMDLCRLLETKQGDAIYQLEVAFFPLSKVKEKTL